MDLAFTLALIAFALAQLVALLAVLTRHAIPRSPRAYHVPLAFSIPAAIAAAFIAAFVLQPFTPSTVLGLGFFEWLFVIIVADAVTYWALNGYALGWHLSLRHRR